MTSNDPQQQVPPKKQSNIAASSITTNHNYLIYPTQQSFETSMYRISNMTPDELTNFEDSLLAISITPLRQTLSENDTLWDGLENLTSVLNNDLIIQIEDKIIKIDKVSDKAYILSTALTEYLPQLRNSELVTDTIILHETLDKPIFEEAEEIEGSGKKGIFCNDRWANRREQIAYSWDNLWQVPVPPNGTVGIMWKIRYASAGIWFSITANARVVKYSNNQIMLSTNDIRYPVQHNYYISWSRRCGKSDSYSDPYEKIFVHNQLDNTVSQPAGINVYSNIRALKHYDFQFFARHRMTSNGPAFNCTSWPLRITD